MEDPLEIKERELHDEKINEKLGEPFKESDFSDDPGYITPNYEPCDNEEGETVPKSMPDINDADENTCDQCVGAEVAL